MDIVLTLVYCLVLTIIVETSFAFIFGVRGWKNIINIILVQILTNPLLVSLQLYFRLFADTRVENIAVPIMEIIAVLIEGFVYYKVLDYKKCNPFLFSLLLNTISFGLGLVINYVRTGVLF